MEIRSGSTMILTNEAGIPETIVHGETAWSFAHDGKLFKHGVEYSFASGLTASTPYICGVGRGIRNEYCVAGFRFATKVWIETCTEDVWCEFIPLEQSEKVEKVLWPSPMMFDTISPAWYTLLNMRAGLRVPNGWPITMKKLDFDGMFLTAGCYMPWFAQVKEDAGYIAISYTPWDAGMDVKHEANCDVQVGQWHIPSLGKMTHCILRYTFRDKMNETIAAKIYRSYVKDNGKLITLQEKALRDSKVKDLNGSAFVHFGIKAVVQPDSRFYDHEHPENNAALVTFAERTKQIKELAAHGAKKMYLHLDGWAEPGYDNCHPDYGPACIEAGGWEGMEMLCRTVKECGGMFGIHDQYRDYYRTAPSFDPSYAVRKEDGEIFTQAIWAGGAQSYLCASQALYYVRRNFMDIEENHVMLDGAYLDVFTCNDGDECFEKDHIMTRRDCYEYRRQCFAWLTSHGIMPSSEEAADWALTDLVFAHYAPYEEQMAAPGSEKYGIPVPLFSLVYHDCATIPWMMEKGEGYDYMLYALLNAGVPYLVREGAYPNTDGAFGNNDRSMQEAVDRCLIVQKLQERCGMEEMVSFEMLNEKGTKQRSKFANGIEVTIDLDELSFVTNC